ncbi:MAG: hypothetical protein RI924_683 [Bacteroidota bacterium]|jgi:CBS domain-containing protein
MLAGESIHPAILPLKLSDTVLKARQRMAEFRLKYFPLVDGSQYLGMLSDEALLDCSDENLRLKDLSVPLLHHFVFGNQHVYDVHQLMTEQKIDTVAVLHANKTYEGLIIAEGLLAALAKLTAVTVPGSVVVLEVPAHDFSLAHLSQIVESDHAIILSSGVCSFEDANRLEVTLKLNRTEINGIVAAFERYNYKVLAVFNEFNSDHTYSDRYEQLMKYLNI